MGEEVEELVKRLTIRARDCESMALDFRDIGGRNADAKADEYTAAFRDFRAAIDTIESLRASLTRAEEERDADGFALEAAAAWLERWAAHVGRCRGGAECTCGLTAIRRDVQTRCLSRASGSELRGDHNEERVAQATAKSEE